MVRLKEGNPLGVRRPQVSVSHAELLLIDPIQIAVQHVGRAAGRQPKQSAVRQISEPQIVLVNEGNQLTVWRKLRVTDPVQPRRQLPSLAACELVQVQASGAGEQQPFRIRLPQVAGYRIAAAPLAFPLFVRGIVQSRGQRRHLPAAH